MYDMHLLQATSNSRYMLCLWGRIIGTTKTLASVNCNLIIVCLLFKQRGISFHLYAIFALHIFILFITSMFDCDLGNICGFSIVSFYIE